MIIITSFCLKQKEPFLVTIESRNTLGYKNVKCSASCFNILGVQFIYYKRNLAAPFRDTLRAKFQLCAVGCTCENRLSHLDLPKPGACVAVAIHGVWEGGGAGRPGGETLPAAGAEGGFTRT